MAAKQPLTPSQMAAWEEAGRADFHAAVPCPRMTSGSRPEIVCRARGWLLAASELMPGGWVKEIPPRPATDEQKAAGEGFR
jgi:hypothetical protein